MSKLQDLNDSYSVPLTMYEEAIMGVVKMAYSISNDFMWHIEALEQSDERSKEFHGLLTAMTSHKKDLVKAVKLARHMIDAKEKMFIEESYILSKEEQLLQQVEARLKTPSWWN